MAIFNNFRWSERLGIGAVGKLAPEMGGGVAWPLVRVLGWALLKILQSKKLDTSEEH